MGLSLLAEARRKKHWTSEYAADLIGVATTTLSRWEQGKTIPHPSNIERICAIYGMSAFELGLELNEEPPIAISASFEEIKEIKSFISADLTMQLLSLAFIRHQSHQHLHDSMTRIIEEYDMNTNNAIPRREALRRLATFPIVTFGLNEISVTSRNTWHAEDMLSQCAASIGACRELSKGKDSSAADLALVFRAVSVYLPMLKTIMQESSQHRKEAASLAAQCIRLKTMLGRIGWQQENLQQATMYADEALLYAREADDPALLVSTLTSQAWVFYYDHQNRQSLNSMKEAMVVLKQNENVPKSLLVRAYSAKAVMEARNGLNSIDTLRNAHKMFNSLNNDYFAFSEQIMPEVIGNEALMHYNSRDYNKAMNAFDQLIDGDSLASKQPLSGKAKSEMLNVMTLTSLKSPNKDLEKSLYLWKAGLQAAKTLNSKQRFRELVSAYDIMETVWPQEQRVKESRELLSLN